MVCDVCGNNQVVVEITEITGGSSSASEGSGVRQLRLCEKCAAERGVETTFLSTQLSGLVSSANPAQPSNPQDQLTSFLQTVHQQLANTQNSTAIDNVRCSFCSSTFKDFRSNGRLGCAHCYQTFEINLRDILRRVHGNSRHAGRRYDPSSSYETGVSGVSGTPDTNVHQIRDRLRRAIEAEEFELAASLRDKLRGLE